MFKFVISLKNDANILLIIEKSSIFAKELENLNEKICNFRNIDAFCDNY